MYVHFLKGQDKNRSFKIKETIQVTEEGTLGGLCLLF
jgi:hypothetical protein